jgi:DNA modification methylase
MPTTLPVNQIVQGHVLETLSVMPSSSVDMVITSPPYWALRDYQTADQIWGESRLCKHDWSRGSVCIHCSAWRGQLGLEPTFDMFVGHLCDVFDQVQRILKPEGTCWVNLGDTYSGSSCGKGDTRNQDGVGSRVQQLYTGQKAGKTKLPDKCLIQIPARFAIEMCNRGWILRNTIVWHKPNCLPTSIKDRFAMDFEYLFCFAKSRRYFFDGDAVREPHDHAKKLAGIKRARLYGYDGRGSYADWYFKRRKKTDWVAGQKTLSMGMYASRGQAKNKPPLIHPLGRSKRSVWSIPTKPFAGAHFAVYPAALLETPIKAGCPQGGIVLDPFIGSGTTALVALQLDRNFVGIELNPEYIRIAEKRLDAVLPRRREAA